MKRVIIRNLDGVQTHGAEMLDPQPWIEECVLRDYWGKKARWVLASESYNESDVIDRETREKEPAIPTAVNEDGGELAPAVSIISEEWVKLRAEYTIEIQDIAAEVEQERINREALEYLASTDWLIIRELDAGIPCPADVKQARAEARSRIVR
jgi:hypothetical protein